MKSRKTKRARTLAARRGKFWHCEQCGCRVIPPQDICRACLNDPPNPRAQQEEP